VEEVQGQHAILRNCIEQLRAVESSRANLVSHLREALQEQVGWQTILLAKYQNFHLLFYDVMILGDLTWFWYQEYKLDQVRNQLQVSCVYLSISSSFVVELSKYNITL